MAAQLVPGVDTVFDTIELATEAIETGVTIYDYVTAPDKKQKTPEDTVTRKLESPLYVYSAKNSSDALVGNIGAVMPTRSGPQYHKVNIEFLASIWKWTNTVSGGGNNFALETQNQGKMTYDTVTFKSGQFIESSQFYVSLASDKEKFYPLWDADGATERIPGNISAVLTGQFCVKTLLFTEMIDVYTVNGTKKCPAGQAVGLVKMELHIYTDESTPYTIWFKTNMDLPSYA